jgi:hypothetical protein
LISYGVDYYEDTPDVRDWTNFKDISQLKKSSEVLEEYYCRLITICQSILCRTPDMPPIPEKDLDGMTPDKARKLVKRLQALKRLRQEVITNPKVLYYIY